jgi:hypothetical protein
VETSSLFAQVIQDHLELKQKNSELEGELPIDRYKSEDPFENHPLFKTEEQARIEETMDGEEPAITRSPGRPTSRRPRRKASGASRATSTGATEVRRLRFALIGAALAYFFDPDNGTKRRKGVIKRLAELRAQSGGELADDLVGQTRAVQEPSTTQD